VLERDCTQHPMWDIHLMPALRWMNCHDCDHIFTEHYWTEQGLSYLMRKTQPSQSPLTQQHLDVQRAISGRLIERVLDGSSTVGRNWLDVGFGSGALLTTAKEFGFSCVGLDLRKESVAAMEAQGIVAYEQTIEEMSISNFEDDFDVVSLMDVLEHVKSPAEMLSAAAAMMKDDGRLIVSTPRMDCAMWDVLEKRGNPYWAEVEHHHIFTLSRLRDLLAQFKLVPIRYSISERYLSCMELTCVLTSV
jgi:2-polyprenyl-3-methyl-5-hydroxy-6-metoxy-1,4-benzoquinol methylase